ncbi:MAG: universal stress protein [Cytophagaceae bacterium]|nr:universal stress protein [Cytophagaceae bacterium]MDW8456670.1 universal stress protein [Cytophagaceae bacterium]
MKNILCPVDFNEHSWNAVLYGAELARILNANLILFHSYHYEKINVGDNFTTYTSVIPGFSYNESKDKAEAYLQKLKNDFPELHSRFSYLLKSGFVYDEILSAIKETNASMVVMSTEGAHGFAGVFLGSLTSDLIESVKIPLLAIPAGHPYKPWKYIVYASDLEEEDTSLIEFTIHIAKPHNAHIALLHVADYPDTEKKRELTYQLEHTIYLQQYKNYSLHVIRDTDVVRGVQQYADIADADLIIMAMHKRNFLEKIFTQSYTKELAKHTHIPLLALHKDEIIPFNN